MASSSIRGMRARVRMLRGGAGFEGTRLTARAGWARWAARAGWVDWAARAGCQGPGGRVPGAGAGAGARGVVSRGGVGARGAGARPQVPPDAARPHGRRVPAAAQRRALRRTFPLNTTIDSALENITKRLCV